jgi:hypothetical protein
MLKFSGAMTAILGAAVVLAASAAAQAASVNYTTSGVFGNNLASISSGGITITFNPASQVSVGTPSNISLGTFTVTGASQSAVSFSDTFTLTVQQTVPTPTGSAAFGQGSVSGAISYNSSSGYVQFTSPLSVSIASVPQTTYTITSADSGHPGRVALISPNGNLGVGGPDGTTSIQGAVIAAPLPAAAWAGLSLLGGMASLRSMRRRAVA